MTQAKDGTVVVVGDGGLLTWGLAYYLRKSWKEVVVVGEQSPRESMLTSAAVDVEPRRVPHYMTIRNIVSGVWLKSLEKLFGTNVPPQNYNFNGCGVWVNPQFYNYAIRMLCRTRESTLDEYDIPQTRLSHNSTLLLNELQKEIPQYLPRSKLIIDDNIHSLYFENQSFSDQRNRLVRLNKVGISRSCDISKGSDAADLYPTLYSVRQWIRKDIKYSTDVADLSFLTKALREFCLTKNTKHVPLGVSSFKSELTSDISSVITSDGNSISCDAVVLSSGYDNVKLLLKAGFYGIVPPLIEIYNYGIDVSNDELSLIPKRSFTIENGVGFLQSKDSVKITGLHTFGSPMSNQSPRYEYFTSGQLYDEVVDRFRTELDRFANIPLNTNSVTAVHVDAAALTPDSLPLIGKLEASRFHSRPSNVYLCCGLGLAGGSSALGAAKLTAAISSGDETDIPSEPYLPSRFWFSS